MSRRRYLLAAAAMLLGAGAALAAPPSAGTTVADPSTLPGINTGDAPWPVELEHLKARLEADKLPALEAEGTVLHTHQHLDIFIDGRPIPVPTGIGINDDEQFISPVHVHDDTNIIHVESPKVERFTLGQFFDIWSVRFDAKCIGGYCASPDKSLQVYVNGKPQKGDPRNIDLKAHQEIVIVFGTPDEAPKKIPTSFKFPKGF
jgi:hypothetical protein